MPNDCTTYSSLFLLLIIYDLQSSWLAIALFMIMICNRFILIFIVSCNKFSYPPPHLLISFPVSVNYMKCIKLSLSGILYIATFPNWAHNQPPHNMDIDTLFIFEERDIVWFHFVQIWFNDKGSFTCGSFEYITIQKRQLRMKLTFFGNVSRTVDFMYVEEDN